MGIDQWARKDGGLALVSASGTSLSADMRGRKSGRMSWIESWHVKLPYRNTELVGNEPDRFNRKAVGARKKPLRLRRGTTEKFCESDRTAGPAGVPMIDQSLDVGGENLACLGLNAHIAPPHTQRWY